MAKPKQKQQLAEALAADAAGIEIDKLEGGRNEPPNAPQTLTPAEQQERDKAFSARFTGLGGLKKEAEPDTISNNDTVSNNDTELKSDTVITRPEKRSPVHAKPPAQQKKRINRLKQAPGDTTIAQILKRNGNLPAVLESGFTAVLWTVDDLLAPTQTPAEQTVYRHLYRLAYGFGNTHCFVGYDALRRRCQMTTNTLKKALTGLAEKSHIEILENVNTKHHKATVYLVKLPEDIDGLNGDLDDYQIELPDTKIEEQDTISNIDTVSNSNTVVRSDTVANNRVKNADTVSKFDTTRTDITSSRTDINLLNQPSTLEASYVQDQITDAGLVLTEIESQKVTDEEHEYIHKLPSEFQSQIYEAMDLWEANFPELPLPKATRLNEWLQGIRESEGSSMAEGVLGIFGKTLRDTREKDPRDVVGWLTAGFKKGYLVEMALDR